MHKSKATHVLNGSLSQVPRMAGAAVSSSYWIREVHHGASCTLLQQEIPLWAMLRLAPSCQPTLSWSRSYCLKENRSSSAACCSGSNGLCQGPASAVNAAVSFQKVRLSVVPTQLRDSIRPECGGYCQC